MSNILNLIRCLKCGSTSLRFSESEIVCEKCGNSYPIYNGIPVTYQGEDFLKSNNVKVFETLTERYDQWFDEERGKILFENELRAIKTLLKRIQIRDSLEIGVGTGRFASMLKIKYGLDPAIKPLLLAKERGIEVIQGIAEMLPFRDKIFDTVFLIVTICFVKDLEKTLSEAKRVLREGGYIVIGYIDRESEWGKFYLKKKEMGHPFYASAKFYTFNELEEILKKIDFKIKNVVSTLSSSPQAVKIEKPVEGYTPQHGFITILARKQ